MIQEDTAADDALAAIQDKIDSARAKADAAAELIDTPADHTPDDHAPATDSTGG